MRIAIIGPGAIGCYLAAVLTKGRHEVWLLDKNRQRQAILEKQGVTVEDSGNSWTVAVNVTVEPKDIKAVDLVIVGVKSYDTKEAISRAAELIGENTTVLTLQNGIGNIEIISEVVGQDKVIGGVTNLGVTLLEWGKVRLAGKGETIIGRSDGRIPVQMRALREAFNSLGLNMRISRDINSILWSKLIINVGINALTAITRLANGRILEFDGSRRILQELVREATRIAKRKRIKLIYDDPVAKVEAVCEATSGNISSMLQDILRRKRTEIDFINGVIVRQGQELNIPTPFNAAVVDLVKTIESSYSLAVS